jgi:hypothetical protein
VTRSRRDLDCIYLVRAFYTVSIHDRGQLLGFIANEDEQAVILPADPGRWRPGDEVLAMQVGPAPVRFLAMSRLENRFGHRHLAAKGAVASLKVANLTNNGLLVWSLAGETRP